MFVILTAPIYKLAKTSCLASKCC